MALLENQTPNSHYKVAIMGPIRHLNWLNLHTLKQNESGKY